jgi:hypothetical protein
VAQTYPKLSTLEWGNGSMTPLQGLAALIVIAIVGFVALLLYAVESFDNGRDL